MRLTARTERHHARLMGDLTIAVYDLIAGERGWGAFSGVVEIIPAVFWFPCAS